MIKLFSLSLLLIVAGLIHLIAPQLFMPALPSCLPLRSESIFLSGLLEIVLGLGILRKNWQDIFAKMIAFYFLFLIPLHIYVAMNGIEMFGIQQKFLLWIRCLFQFGLIFWAASLESSGWIIEQRWKNVLFLHYKVDPVALQKIVPFKLDLHEGRAVISIVPLLMDGIRFPFLPSIPWVSKLWELNIRTYVEVNGIKGVYFFSLETDSKLGEFIANKFFHLPYRYSKIKSQIIGNEYDLQHSRNDFSFLINANVLENKAFCPFEFWATERYSLFTKKGDRIYRGIVMHQPWKLQEIKINQLEDQFSKLVSSNLGELVGSSYARELKVRFRPFTKVSPKGT